MNASHERGMEEVLEISFTDEEAAQAEEQLDALGNTNNPQGTQVTHSAPQAAPITTDILQAAIDSQGLNESGYQVRKAEKSYMYAISC